MWLVVAKMDTDVLSRLIMTYELVLRDTVLGTPSNWRPNFENKQVIFERFERTSVSGGSSLGKTGTGHETTQFCQGQFHSMEILIRNSSSNIANTVKLG